MKVNFPRINEILFISLFSIIPLIYVPASLEFHFIAKTSFFYFILSILIALSLLIFLRARAKLHRTPLDILFFFFILLLVLSSVEAINKPESAETITYFMSLIAFYYVSSFTLSFEGVRKIISFAIHSAFVISIIAVIQAVVSSGFTLQETVTSTFGHSNLLAQYLIAVFPLAFCRNLETGRKYSMIYLFETPLIFSAIMLTYCRGAWLGFGFSFLLMFVLLLKSGKLLKNSTSVKFFSFLTAALFLISIPIILKNPGVITSLIPKYKAEKAVTETNDEYAEISKIRTVKQRRVIWKGTGKICWENPLLGVGAGNFKIHIPRYMPASGGSAEKNIVKWAHNDFFQIAAESGIVASIIFLLIVVRVILKSFSVNKFSEDKIMVVIPLSVSVAATVVQSLTSFNFYQTVPAIFLFFSFAVIMNGERMVSLHDDRAEKVNWPTILILVAFSLSSLLFFIRKPLAEVYYVKASKALQESDWKESNLNIKKCLKLNSGKGKYLYTAALTSYGLSDFNSALKYSSKAKALTPNVSELLKLYIFSLNECGNRSYATGRIEESVKYYSDAVNTFEEIFSLPLTEKEKRNYRNLASVAYNNLGNSLINKGDFKGARIAFKISLVFNPAYLPSSQRLKENPASG